ncbi:MAG TPA: cytochrome c [Woeseiaceae bacterium]|nr:cytochrome c [Woeseiaceae bacterium]
MRQSRNVALLVLLLVGVAACQSATVSRQQIVLPEGDAAAGEQAFVALECTACHTIAGKELPDAEEVGPVTITLGGKTSRTKSYSELVTSVINPSHKLARNPFKQQIADNGESVMPVFNDIMTVTQLIDIVTFLESQYEIVERPRYRYPVYTY